MRRYSALPNDARTRDLYLYEPSADYYWSSKFIRWNSGALLCVHHSAQGDRRDMHAGQSKNSVLASRSIR